MSSNYSRGRNVSHNVSKSSNQSQNVMPPTATIDLKSLASENQCIKLIPSVEEIFRKNGFGSDSNLDEGTRIWLHKLQESWNLWKKNANVVNLLNNFFETSSDPFTSVLVLVINCQSFSDSKPNTLPYQIVDQLKEWSNRNPAVPPQLTSNVKLTAFNIAKEQKNFSFVKLVVDTYRITEENENFLPYVKGMLNSGKYKLAYQSILALNLQKHIEIEALLVPLVFQDKSNLVDDYLSTCPEQAADLVQFLDNLLDRNISIKVRVETFLRVRDVPDVNWGKLYHKPLGKLISRLCHAYNVPLNTCHNLSRSRAIGGIRFLIHQKYQENVISDNAWNDLVVDTISDKPDLVVELVNLVNDYDSKEAYKWAKYFNLPERLYPDMLNSYLSSQDGEVEEETWDSPPSTSQEMPPQYHRLCLPPERVILIDTAEAFKDALYNGLMGETLIGLDSEWKPSFGAKQSTVSLIQIATKSCVFLFDVLALNDQQYTGLWTILAENILDNNSVVKLGFGLENDMREIRASVPGLGSIKFKGFGYLELFNLWKSALTRGVYMPYPKPHVGEGLSSIVEQCFGMPLSKHEQCSNWENRPLRGTQIEYAALDAFVLLEAYGVFEQMCLKMGRNFEDLCYQVMAQSELSKIKKPRKKHGRDKAYTNYSQGPNQNPISVEYTKLLIDRHWAALASYLRCCGIDTILSMENDKWETWVNTACLENRYMVIKSAEHKRVSTLIPRNHVYILQSSSIEDQIKEIISYFNINLKPEQIFGRCQTCNGNDLVVISRQVMQRMTQIYNSSFTSHTDVNQFEALSIDQKQSNVYNKSKSISSQTWTRSCDTASTSAVFEDNDGNVYDDEEDDFPVHENRRLPPEQIYTEQCLTCNRVKIQLQPVTDAVLKGNENFHICQSCGKCHWRNGFLPPSINTLILQLSQTN